MSVRYPCKGPGGHVRASSVYLCLIKPRLTIMTFCTGVAAVNVFDGAPRCAEEEIGSVSLREEGGS